MKLLTKTTLFFFTIALFVLFVGGITFYFFFRYMVNREVKKELVTEMHRVLLNPPKNNIVGVDSFNLNFPVHYQIIPIGEIQKTGFVFGDTLLFDNIMGHYQPYIVLSYETNLNGKPVHISISKSLLISDELIEYVAIVTLFLSLILLFCVVSFNNYFFAHIWGNFFKTINIIKDYNISDTKEIAFAESEITEFNQLNQVFERMHQRTKQDYQNLKEFIENTSHEIQTPLAIIKSKVDLLQQNENLDKSQVELIQSIQSSAIKLSNLNKSLILLSKIDNNQFAKKEDVDILENINFHLANFDDIIQSKNISLHKAFNNQLMVLADTDLISIMLLNLLKNSIFHNLPSGTVEIIIESKSLIIKNSGKKLEISEADLFKRFTKSSHRSDSLGLGLAIVKKICDYYGYGIQYLYQNNFHTVRIDFN